MGTIGDTQMPQIEYTDHTSITHQVQCHFSVDESNVLARQIYNSRQVLAVWAKTHGLEKLVVASQKGPSMNLIDHLISVLLMSCFCQLSFNCCDLFLNLRCRHRDSCYNHHGNPGFPDPRL
jgi:hypothetical protein